MAVNTDSRDGLGICQPGKEIFLEKQKQYLIPPRTIVVFMGKVWEEKTEKDGKKEKAPKKGKGRKTEKGRNGGNGADAE